MTKQAFSIFLNNLVENYNHEVRNSSKDTPIGQFLDDQGVDREIVKDINPLHLVEEISKCDLEDGITLDYTDSTEFTTKFKILMGLCECVSYVNRPVPTFHEGDILRGNTARNDIRYIKDFIREDDEYVVENIDGDIEFFSRERMEDRYHKMGELTNLS